MRTVSRTEITDLEKIPNVGPAISANLRLSVRHDPCVIDGSFAAVRFMAGEPSKPWRKYTPERKRTLGNLALQLPASRTRNECVPE